MFGNNVVGDISEISTFCHLGSAVPIDQMLGLINGYGLARAFKQVPTVYLAKKLFFFHWPMRFSQPSPACYVATTSTR